MLVGSLRTRIFLFVIVLLLVILGAFSFAAFGEVRDSLTQMAEARLASAAFAALVTAAATVPRPRA